MTDDEIKRQLTEGLDNVSNQFYRTQGEAWSTYYSTLKAARATARAAMGEEAWAALVACEAEIDAALETRLVATNRAQDACEKANAKVWHQYDEAMWLLHKAPIKREKRNG